ncbi:Hypothetical protein, putative, partial [Bodo saltans]
FSPHSVSIDEIDNAHKKMEVFDTTPYSHASLRYNAPDSPSSLLHQRHNRFAAGGASPYNPDNSTAASSTYQSPSSAYLPQPSSRQQQHPFAFLDVSSASTNATVGRGAVRLMPPSPAPSAATTYVDPSSSDHPRSLRRESMPPQTMPTDGRRDGRILFPDDHHKKKRFHFFFFIFCEHCRDIDNAHTKKWRSLARRRIHMCPSATTHQIPHHRLKKKIDPSSSDHPRSLRRESMPPQTIPTDDRRDGRILFPDDHHFQGPVGVQPSSASIVSSLPQLMGQTRLVSTRLSQIRNELETIVQSIWGQEDGDQRYPNSSFRSTSLTSNNKGGVGGSFTSTQTSKPATPLDSDPLVTVIATAPAPNVSLTELHDALGVVEQQIVAVQHTRRIVTRAMERPLAEMKVQHQASSPDRRLGSSSGAGGAPPPVTAGAALRNRVWIALEFGEQEIQLLLREIQHLQGHLLTVERRLLALLGVVDNHHRNQNTFTTNSQPSIAETVADAANGGGAVTSSTASSFTPVFRRREGVDLPSVRREVEASMRRDPRYALLASTRAALQQQQHQASTFRAAGAAAKTLVEDCGWEPNRVQYRSHYNYELDRLDELIAREQEKQQNIKEGRSAASSPSRSLRMNAHQQNNDKDSDALVESIVDPGNEGNPLVSGGVLEHSTTTDDAAVSAQSYPLGVGGGEAATAAFAGANEFIGGDSSMAELADALQRLSPLPSSKTPDSAVSVNSHQNVQQQRDENPDPLPPAAEATADEPKFAEVDDAAGVATASEADNAVSQRGRPPTPIHFGERVRDYIRSFLRSGACQWVACQDETTNATFYFNLDTGERQETLEGYFEESVAESIAQQLLDEGERVGDGWIFVPGGSSEYGDEDYYCHQRSGEVTWSLVDYVKQH